jgi:catechol 2,3-dioxygenase-like lactoylglutathione lyase family enzyme
MLGDSSVTVTVAVKDMAAAKEFYTGVLGLAQTDENPGGVTFGSGDKSIFVYESQFAGTNKATYAAWHVDDLPAVVADLKGKGVSFQTFEIPGVTWEGEIAILGPAKSAWFADPDGNIFAVDSGM